MDQKLERATQKLCGYGTGAGILGVSLSSEPTTMGLFAGSSVLLVVARGILAVTDPNDHPSTRETLKHGSRLLGRGYLRVYESLIIEPSLWISRQLARYRVGTRLSEPARLLKAPTQTFLDRGLGRLYFCGVGPLLLSIFALWSMIYYAGETRELLAPSLIMLYLLSRYGSH